MATDPGGGHFVTAEQIRNARRNVERFDWAEARRDRAVERAGRWTKMDDEALWGLVTGQMIGRSTAANVEMGCPVCRDGMGRFEMDVLADPWKIRCPTCGGRFPTNDFEAFYKSGIGPDGTFDPDRADRGLLFNTDHPHPDDPLHRFGVDDGMGWTDETDASFKLVGVYAHYGVWSEISSACEGLREAFLLTGDAAYAHRAGLLLARIADVYPDMDWSFWAKQGFFNSDGLSGRGRIFGRIWEPYLLKAFTECYDMVRTVWKDNDPLFAFLDAKQKAHGLPEQNSVAALCRHFETHVIREGIKAIVAGDIHHNEPGDQSTMAMLAIALDAGDTEDWLDWVFREGLLRGQKPDGGHIPQLFAGEIDRDGVGSEGSPGYSLGWLRWPIGMKALVQILDARPSYTRHRIRDHPRYRQMFLAPIRLTALGRFVPSIGDTGNTGGPGLGGLTIAQCLEGLAAFGDPIFAQAAHHLAEGDLSRIQGQVTDADPEAIRKRVAQIVHTHGPLRLHTDVMTGYGLALLRDGEGERERTLWVYYGRNTGHGHADRLNLGIYGFGMDLLPDLGYPEHARIWPKRAGWTNHTVSHNTVMVDRSRQGGTYSGKVDFIGLSEEAQAIGLSSPDVYPQCAVYGRTSAMVCISEDDFYAVDLFRVSGGGAHHYLFHAAEGEVETGGLDLVPQQQGTYAGENVAFGEFYDGEVETYTGSGFQYLYDVQRCRKPDGVISVDWTVRDTWQVFQQSGKPMVTDVHVRWSLFDAPGEVALCRGDPPQNKPGNPRRLTYVVAAHEGEGPVVSGFLSLIEAYRGNRLVERVEEVPVSGGEGIGSRAIRVHLPGGRSDTVVFGDGRTQVRVDGRLDFDGVFGVYSETDGTTRWAMLTGGRVLGTKDRAIRRASGVWTGTVLERAQGKIWTAAEPPAEGSLIGSYLSIENDNERDACYRVAQVTREGDRTLINVGDVDFVRGMIDDLDYSKGFAYDFEPGQTFRIAQTWFERFS